MNEFEIKNLIEKFVLDKAWQPELLLDCCFNRAFLRSVKNAIQIFSDHEINYTQIEKTLSQFKNKSQYYFKKYQRTSRLEDLMNGETYWMFIELTTNNSALTLNIQQQLFNSFGKNYVKELAKIDKLSSADVKNNIAELKPCLQNYLTVKKWQDIQHNFVSSGNLDWVYEQIHSHFPDVKYNHDAVEYKFQYYLSLVLYKDVKTVSDFAKLYLACPDHNLAAYIGGKSAGLVKLYCLGLNIPTTFFVDKYSITLQNLLNKNKKYAIRSSANIEDGDTSSFAGMFESSLNVEYRNIEQEIAFVLKSVNTQRVKVYCKQNQVKVKPVMHIIVQEFIDPDFAGVWLGNKNNINYGVLEYVNGCGDKLVSGTQNPKRLIFRGKKKEIANVFEKIANTMSNIQKLTGKAMDIEWCLQGETFYYLQARAVTTNIDQLFKVTKKKGDYKATPASPGVATGCPVLLNTIEEFIGTSGNEILMTWFTTPEWVPIMKKYKGVITSVGGFLSHAAIICRELDIPCIVGLDQNEIISLINLQKIEMDGSTGTIKIIKG